MPVKFSNVKDAVDDNGIKLLVHGPAGAGKTVLCATAQERTLLINAEGGLLSLRKDGIDTSHMTVATIRTFDDLYEVYNLLVRNPGDFKWVNLDSITEIAEVVLSHEKEQNKDPRKAYMEMQERVLKLLRSYRDLPHYNICMTAKQRAVKDEYSGITYYGPSFPGQQLSPAVPYLFDEVFALRVEKNEAGEYYRVLQTSRDIQYEAKDRSGMLNMWEYPSLQNILYKIRGGTEAIGETSSQETSEDAAE